LREFVDPNVLAYQLATIEAMALREQIRSKLMGLR
jgi:hypothetical protein